MVCRVRGVYWKLKKRDKVKIHKKDLLGHHACLGTESQGLVHVVWHFAPLSMWNQTRGPVCHAISACFVKNAVFVYLKTPSFSMKIRFSAT